MNEVTRIHLGRQPFVIAIDAHKLLRDYLDAIKKAVGKSHNEVLKEVELRMAELLTERGVTGDKAILAEDVDFLKEQLGKPGDFKADDDEESTEDADETSEEDTPSEKRLFRDEQNGMVSGVAAGLAAYFNIDAVIVRLIFILLTVMFGWGALMYILLWIVVPPAKTSSDRLKMRGKAVTVESLTEAINREATAAARHAGHLGHATSALFAACWKATLAMTGFCTAALAVLALCAVWAAGGYILFNHDGLLQELVSFPVGIKETVLTIALFILANIALFWVYLGGLAMMKRKWTLPGWITGATVGIFFVALAAGSIVAPDAGRQVYDRYEAAHRTSLITKGNEQFTRVDMKGNIAYRYEQSSEYKVTLRYFSKQQPEITAVAKDGVMTIDATRYTGQTGCDSLCISIGGFPEAIIYAPSIEQITVDGDTVINEIRDGDEYQPAGYVNSTGNW